MKSNEEHAITGMLFFSKPNRYTQPISGNPNLFSLSYRIGAYKGILPQLSQEEDWRIGTDFGRIPYDRKRIDVFRKKDCNPFQFASDDEKWLIGTRIGTTTNDMKRVEEYILYRTGQKTLTQLLMDKNPFLTLHEIQENYSSFYRQKMKEWYGDDYVCFF
jgi:hypothetical protein